MASLRKEKEKRNSRNSWCWWRMPNNVKRFFRQLYCRYCYWLGPQTWLSLDREVAVVCSEVQVGGRWCGQSTATPDLSKHFALGGALKFTFWTKSDHKWQENVSMRYYTLLSSGLPSAFTDYREVITISQLQKWLVVGKQQLCHCDRSLCSNCSGYVELWSFQSVS